MKFHRWEICSWQSTWRVFFSVKFIEIERSQTFETVVHVASHNIIKRKIIMMVNLSHR